MMNDSTRGSAQRRVPTCRECIRCQECPECRNDKLIGPLLLTLASTSFYYLQQPCSWLWLAIFTVQDIGKLKETCCNIVSRDWTLRLLAADWTDMLIVAERCGGTELQKCRYANAQKGFSPSRAHPAGKFSDAHSLNALPAEKLGCHICSSSEISSSYVNHMKHRLQRIGFYYSQRSQHK